MANLARPAGSVAPSPILPGSRYMGRTERMQSLEIPAYATGAAALREMADQQEVQQQQQ